MNKLTKYKKAFAGKEGVTGDVGGHAQACSLGGTCGRFNLFPQNGNFDNSAYKKWENEIRNALEKGTKVDNVAIKFNRSTSSNARPDSLRVTDNIGGVPRTKDFLNMSSK
jgi:filamentous hemagglutinin